MLMYISAFLTSAATSLAMRGPKHTILPIGVIGLLGWAGYQLGLIIWPGSGAFSAFLGALVVGVAAEVFARRLHQPTILFIIPGLFPLVPGIMAYRGTLALINGELTKAAATWVETLLYAGGLAVGLTIPPAVLRRRIR
ncbi:MAG TPA: threonine/serine exporter family protein [Symbiobacteriaceae bacterium]|nr:threonine/serine exporter family protein [Symbiobacteriaceae bacterium]